MKKVITILVFLIFSGAYDSAKNIHNKRFYLEWRECCYSIF